MNEVIINVAWLVVALFAIQAISTYAVVKLLTTGRFLERKSLTEDRDRDRSRSSLLIHGGRE